MALVLVVVTEGGLRLAASWLMHPTHSAMEGLYAVEYFDARDPVPMPLHVMFGIRWAQVAVGSRDAAVLFADGSFRYFRVDDGSSRWEMKTDEGPAVAGFDVQRADTAHVVLRDAVNGIEVHLRRMDRGQLPLLNRGFHWVNELPFNQ